MLGLRFCAKAFSSCGERGPLFIAVRGPLLLRSTGSRRTGSVVVAHGPSCSAACGIFPDQGSNPCLLHWQADSQPLHHQGSPGLGLLTSRDLRNEDHGRWDLAPSHPKLIKAFDVGVLSLWCKVLKKFCDSITPKTHKLCLVCLLVMDEGNLPCYKFSSSSLSLTEDPTLDGSLIASGIQDTGGIGGSPLAAFSLHEELLLAELEVGGKKMCANSNLSWVRRRKGSD